MHPGQQQGRRGPREFGVLELLLGAQGRAVSAEELLERVWDEAADPFSSAVKVTISRLRRKLGGRRRETSERAAGCARH